MTIQTNKELFTKLLSIYQEILLLEDDIKIIKEDTKESNLDFSGVASLAKAKAKQKFEEVGSKAQATLDLIDELND
jgi:hypothetical protein